MAAIRAVSTRSPASRSSVWDTATRVRRTRSRRVAHSACQPPSARSSTCWAAARCSVAASCGVVRAARRTSTDSTGLALLRHRRRAAAGCPRRARRSRDATCTSTSLAIRAHASVQPTRASPSRVIGRAGRVPARHADRRLATELDDRGAGAGGPAELVGEGQPGEVVVRVEHRRQPGRRPGSRTSSARRAGSASARPSGCRGGRRRAGEPLDDEARSRRRSATAASAIRISAESTTSWLVRPRCSLRGVLAQPRAGSTSAITGLPPISASRASHSSPVGHLEVAADQSASTADHRPEERLRGEVVAGAVVAGPEQVGHGLSLARRTGRRSRPRPAAGCRRRSPGRRHAAARLGQRARARRPAGRPG